MCDESGRASPGSVVTNTTRDSDETTLTPVMCKGLAALKDNYHSNSQVLFSPFRAALLAGSDVGDSSPLIPFQVGRAVQVDNSNGLSHSPDRDLEDCVSEMSVSLIPVLPTPTGDNFGHQGINTDHHGTNTDHNGTNTDRRGGTSDHSINTDRSHSTGPDVSKVTIPLHPGGASFSNVTSSQRSEVEASQSLLPQEDISKGRTEQNSRDQNISRHIMGDNSVQCNTRELTPSPVDSTGQLAMRLEKLVASLHGASRRQMLVIETTIVQCVKRLQGNIRAKLKVGHVNTKQADMMKRLLKSTQISLSSLMDHFKSQQESLSNQSVPPSHQVAITGSQSIFCSQPPPGSQFIPGSQCIPGSQPVAGTRSKQKQTAVQSGSTKTAMLMELMRRQRDMLNLCRHQKQLVERLKTATRQPSGKSHLSSGSASSPIKVADDHEQLDQLRDGQTTDVNDLKRSGKRKLTNDAHETDQKDVEFDQKHPPTGEGNQGNTVSSEELSGKRVTGSQHMKTASTNVNKPTAIENCTTTIVNKKTNEGSFMAAETVLQEPAFSQDVTTIPDTQNQSTQELIDNKSDKLNENELNSLEVNDSGNCPSDDIDMDILEEESACAVEEKQGNKTDNSVLDSNESLKRNKGAEKWEETKSDETVSGKAVSENDQNSKPVQRSEMLWLNMMRQPDNSEKASGVKDNSIHGKESEVVDKSHKSRETTKSCEQVNSGEEVVKVKKKMFGSDANVLIAAKVTGEATRRSQSPTSKVNRYEVSKKATKGASSGVDEADNDQDGRNNGQDGKNNGQDGRNNGQDGRNNDQDGRNNGQDGRNNDQDGRNNGQDGRNNDQDGKNNGQDGRNNGQDGRNNGQDGRNNGQDGRNNGQDGRNNGQNGRNNGQDGRNNGQNGRNNGTRDSREFSNEDTDPLVSSDEDAIQMVEEQSLTSPPRDTLPNEIRYNVSPTATSMSSDIFVVKAKELQKRMKRRAMASQVEQQSEGMANISGSNIPPDIRKTRSANISRVQPVILGRDSCTETLGIASSKLDKDINANNEKVTSSFIKPRKNRQSTNKDTVDEAIEAVINQSKGIVTEDGHQKQSGMEQRDYQACRQAMVQTGVHNSKVLPSNTATSDAAASTKERVAVVKKMPTVSKLQRQPLQFSQGSFTFLPSSIPNIKSISSTGDNGQKGGQSQKVLLVQGSSQTFAVPGQSQQGFKNAKKGENVFPTLKELVDTGRLQPGKNVLSATAKGCMKLASLTPQGKIRGPRGALFTTPMQWLSSLKGGIKIKKQHAYQQVMYNERSLMSFCMQRSSSGDQLGVRILVGSTNMPDTTSLVTSQQMSNHSLAAKTTSINPVVSVPPPVESVPTDSSRDRPSMPEDERWLNELLSNSVVRLLNARDLIPCHDLPDNFWIDDFAKVKLHADIWDTVDAW